MKRDDPEVHRRQSIRLKEYDYSQVGAYFITVCTQNRERLFGEIVAESIRLNDAGEMIQTIWNELPAHYPGVEMDAFIVMPNYVHGIIVLVSESVGAGPRACPGRPQGAAPTVSLPDVVHRFKSLTTTRYRHGVKECGWPPFVGRLWQRNYYEHVIRNENDLKDIREYIVYNPLTWGMDPENPRCSTASLGRPCVAALGTHTALPLRAELTFSFLCARDLGRGIDGRG